MKGKPNQESFYGPTETPEDYTINPLTYRQKKNAPWPTKSEIRYSDTPLKKKTTKRKK